jgi:guanosine-3',5'-bis(diphosphate) 3'-pyrophosphohydrolase
MQNSIQFEAMKFAFEVHKNHKRKYTGNPYTDHLAEVVGIVSTVTTVPSHLAIAWLHDSIEDVGVTFQTLQSKFGGDVATGVLWLSDLEDGNRAERKRLSRIRLSNAPNWVQNIKVADMISNTSSIVQHDPNFAKVYLEEKRLLLDVLTKADKSLLYFARNLVINKGE